MSQAAAEDIVRIHQRLDDLFALVSDMREEVVKSVMQYDHLERRVKSLEKSNTEINEVLWNDIGFSANGNHAGGVVDVLRSHHIKLNEIEALRKAVRNMMLKSLAVIAVGSVAGGGAVAWILELIG